VYEEEERKMKRMFAVIIVGILLLSTFVALAPKVRATLPPNDVMPNVATNGAHTSFYHQTTTASTYASRSDTDVEGTRVGTRLEAMPRAVLQSDQLGPATPPPAVYDEQLALIFSQNFTSIAYNVTAVEQADGYGYGPAYLLNGLSNAGYWYQVGLCWDWPYAAGGYAAGFYAVYAVFNSNGNVVFPPRGGAKLDSFNASVNDGDAVLLNLNFSGGNIVMDVYDWNTSAYSVETYGAIGATYFEGLGSASNSNGFFTGLMTEWYHVNPYYGSEEAVTYSDSAFALSSAWMLADEWNTNNGTVLFSGYQIVSYSNPNQLQFFSTNGANEASDAYQFITGTPASSMWVEPSLVSVPGIVGFKFNITVAMNITENVFAYQIGLLYNRTQLMCIGAGYTAGATSTYFAGHTTNSPPPVIDTGELGNGSVLASESLLDNDFIPGPHTGSLIWAEFQILQAPSASQTFNGTFDIASLYPAKTWVEDPNLNNVDITPYDGNYQLEVHDVAVLNANSYKTVVGQGYSLNVSVTAANQGEFTETFNLTSYANTTIIASQNVTLTSGNSTTVTFTWNTTGFAKGNYTISAYAWPVPGETNTANNNFTDGWVVVAMVGDITGPSGWPDGTVDGRDISTVARSFGTVPGDPLWNANCDINNDGTVDGRDISTVAKNFGQVDP
jgi:hypothetical protein